MWEQPHYRYTVTTEDQPGLVSTLPALETEVPGTLVYGLVRNSRRVRLSKLIEEGNTEIAQCVVMTPIHGAWLAESVLLSFDASFTSSPHFTDGIGGWSNQEGSRQALCLKGIELFLNGQKLKKYACG